ncbi:MAG: hotdog domain-containing protein [Planctomycetota bacterium]|nr:hotdog domain-containing protein [Planctomycetota bacterium]
MKKIPNVFLQIPGYRCFGCSPENEFGLKLEFFAVDADTCVTRYDPSENYSGFPGILHGGIASTLLDELAFWTTFHKMGRFGFTGRLNLKFSKATPSDQPLKVVAKVKYVKRRIVGLEGNLLVENTGEKTVTADIVYVLATQKNWEQLTGTPVHESITKYLG